MRSCCCCTRWGAPQADVAWLLAHDDDALPSRAARRLRRSSCERRADGEPRRLSRRAQGVLRPRPSGRPPRAGSAPETELLVDWRSSVLPAGTAPVRARPGHRQRRDRAGDQERAPARQGQRVDRSARCAGRRPRQRRSRCCWTSHFASDWSRRCASEHYDVIVAQPAVRARTATRIWRRPAPRAAHRAGRRRRRAGRHPGRSSRRRRQHLQPGGWLLLEHG